MRISGIELENFRNFQHVKVEVGPDLVIVGENGAGKSNLLYALRLLLDPTLPESARRLRQEDFWDGLPRPLKASDRILISIDLTDFESNAMQLALLADHIVKPEPMVARLTYVWQPLDGVITPSKDSDYDYTIYGGDRAENRLSYQVRARLPLDVLPALRDAEADLARWTRSPLRPLLVRVAGAIDHEALERLAEDVEAATAQLAEMAEVATLTEAINQKLLAMAGDAARLDARLRFTPSDPDRLIRALRMYIDNGVRSLSEASLGAANVLYLALKTLEYEKLAAEGSRQHTFLAIEEPEAHLHPHLQRAVYRSYLRGRSGPQPTLPPPTTVILTTHSPHVTSVAPIESLILLRPAGDATRVTTAAALDLSAAEERDLERYLDVTRGEMLFARAILLVEGDAERYIMPALAGRMGIRLDEEGITICAVGGTEFRPFIKFLGPRGLDVPFAILTDRDPRSSGEPLGDKRVRSEILPTIAAQAGINPPDLKDASAYGVFLNTYTLEIDLLQSGFGSHMAQVMEELSSNGAACKRMNEAAASPATADAATLLGDILAVGKGRFAQRLASVAEADVAAEVPGYIVSAFDFLKKKLSPT